MVQTVVESALPRCRKLIESDIMLLLRPRTVLRDIKKNADLIDALGEGRIYATISESNLVDLFTSPLMLRNSLLLVTNEKEYTNKSRTVKDIE